MKWPGWRRRELRNHPIHTARWEAAMSIARNEGATLDIARAIEILKEIPFPEVPNAANF